MIPNLSKSKRKWATQPLRLPLTSFMMKIDSSCLACLFLDSGKKYLQNRPRFFIFGLGKNSFTKRTSLSRFLAREKFVYKTNLALSFLGSGKIRLQNEFFLLYFLEAKVFNVIL